MTASTDNHDFFRTEPADTLADILSIVLFDMSGSHSPDEVREWRRILLSRPDGSSDKIREAVAVCDDFLNE
ncbi:hypothetical protein T029_25270 [Salmonella enterica subsp. enterica serovar Give]|nr:hypothetical protein [Salmonella enterica subsp. enterica serovar Give]